MVLASPVYDTPTRTHTFGSRCTPHTFWFQEFELEERLAVFCVLAGHCKFTLPMAFSILSLILFFLPALLLLLLHVCVCVCVCVCVNVDECVCVCIPSLLLHVFACLFACVDVNVNVLVDECV